MVRQLYEVTVKFYKLMQTRTYRCEAESHSGAARLLYNRFDPKRIGGCVLVMRVRRISPLEALAECAE